ncbi:hypothetical protein PtrSN002B_001453 [Pyrenophora tritici-repentis]|uniref:Uncharacterized protein n=1 Tax=Pyrenophora tritici-repentis TaxID=45151 RepID=A0A2W1HQE6_9PLEO|nr:hypothetical protein PtrV1_06290 [Pyrenophora tritici-repentis]KAF7451011.1 hypothetical protein A1F99_056270 [Pyrenophora tritici-repentis]KAF7573691.1 hypothetical protein PtrM4_085960 [Pyrenophora tritici-repentis]KAI0582879.1 hypothetical protein Alg215_03896 [Pyrenophora tritici-repentis]KAI0590334.1 hypothetical protein Alg130_02391 [Pyrenophora tritici-repentis]
MSLKSSDWSALLSARKSFVLPKSAMSNQKDPPTEAVPLLSDAETAFPDGRRYTLDSPLRPEPAISRYVGRISKIKLQLDKIRHRSTIDEEKKDGVAVGGRKQRDYQIIRKEWMVVQKGLAKSGAFEPFEEPVLEALDEVFGKWVGVCDEVVMQPSPVRSLETIGEEGLDFLEGDTAVSSPDLGDEGCMTGMDGAKM